MKLTTSQCHFDMALAFSASSDMKTTRHCIRAHKEDWLREKIEFAKFPCLISNYMPIVWAQLLLVYFYSEVHFNEDLVFLILRLKLMHAKLLTTDIFTGRKWMKPIKKTVLNEKH